MLMLVDLGWTELDDQQLSDFTLTRQGKPALKQFGSLKMSSQASYVSVLFVKAF
jgi:hypothetical protein